MNATVNHDTHVAHIEAVVARQRTFFETGATRPVAVRVAALRRLKKEMQKREKILLDALQADLNKSHFEGYMCELGLNLDELGYLADHVRAWSQPRRKPTPLPQFKSSSYELPEPYGVVLIMAPWNYPYLLSLDPLFGAVAAGNCVVLKPSQYTPLTAYILAELIDEAGYPAGVFNLVTGCGPEVGNALALHPDVRMLSFTGSTAAGREVARLALSNIKRIALELGGKSAAILLPGGDWEFGVKAVLDTVVLNAGQTCNALTRLLVPAAEQEKANEIILNTLKQYKKGSNADPESDIGPLSSRRQFDRVKKYIQIGIDEGATLLCGGLPGQDAEYRIDPTVFVNVKPGMRIEKEEIFGPVLVVVPYETVDDAVRIANDSEYGLAGAVFGPEAEANAVARRMRTGSIYVNYGQWDVKAPFGGYKQSGIGREGAVEGYEEFLEVKTIYDREGE